MASLAYSFCANGSGNRADRPWGYRILLGELVFDLERSELRYFFSNTRTGSYRGWDFINLRQIDTLLHPYSCLNTVPSPLESRSWGHPGHSQASLQRLERIPGVSIHPSASSSNRNKLLLVRSSWFNRQTRPRGRTEAHLPAPPGLGKKKTFVQVNSSDQIPRDDSKGRREAHEVLLSASRAPSKKAKKKGGGGPSTE